MAHREHGASPFQQAASPNFPWSHSEFEDLRPLSFHDQSLGAGPSTTPRALFGNGDGLQGSPLSGVEGIVPEVRPAKKKKRGWKGWAVVTQDEDGNLIEVEDEVPEGVHIKPLRAPASATIRVEHKGNGQAPQASSSNGVNHQPVTIHSGNGDSKATDGPVNGESVEQTRHPRRAAASSASTAPQAPTSRRTSSPPRSRTPIMLKIPSKRKRQSEVTPLLAKKPLSRTAGRGVSLPSTEVERSPLPQSATPNLRKSAAVSSLSHNFQPVAAKPGPKSLKGKGKERERPISVEPPYTASSSQQPSSASTPQSDIIEMAPAQPTLPVHDEPPFDDTSPPPLRLGMGVAQSPPAVSKERSHPKSEPRPRPPAEPRWRALPPEREAPDRLLYVPAAPPTDDELPHPYPSYVDQPRPLRRAPSAFELQHEAGFSGVTEAMERDAQGFIQNVKSNLEALIAYTCPYPSVARAAFIERIGRGLQEVGWTMTDQGEL